MKCSNTGCRFSARYDGACVNHASATGHPEAIAEQKRRSTRGQEVKKSGRVHFGLRTMAELLAPLESSLADVSRSSADAHTKAGAVVKLVGEARQILNAQKLEVENAELRGLLAEKYPELKKQLRIA